MATTGKKVMAVGDSGCGKSSLLNVFSKNEVLDVHTPVTFVNEVVDIVVDGKEVTLSLWVSPGEKFGQMAGSMVVMNEVEQTCLKIFLQVRRNINHYAN